MLQAKGIVTGYGQIEVLHGVNLIANRNEITAIIGPNGCGKSTLLKAILGLLPIRKGSVILEGENLTRITPQQAIKRGISIIPQGRIVFPFLTVQENLVMGAYLLKERKLVREKLEVVYQKFPVLADKRRAKAQTLSGGEQTMLCIGRGLMADSRVLLFDEPSLGLAPKVIEIVFQQISQLKDSGLTIVLVEQNIRKALSIANRVFVMNQGLNVSDGTPEQILSDETLKDLYLGSWSTKLKRS